MFYSFLKGFWFYAPIPLEPGEDWFNLIYILFQIRQSVPVAGQKQGRKEKDQGEEAHSQSSV